MRQTIMIDRASRTINAAENDQPLAPPAQLPFSGRDSTTAVLLMRRHP
jgi:hypothetical protein